MRKLLHLVFAVWKTGKPFDRDHYPWEPSAPADTAVADKKTAGHNQDKGPEGSVVTAATSTITPPPPADKAVSGPPPLATPVSAAGGIDYAALRSQISMEQVLAQLGCLTRLKGSGVQRRGPCPIHAPRTRQSFVLGEPGQEDLSVFPSAVWGAWQRPGPVGRRAASAAVRSRATPGRHLARVPDRTQRNREEEPVKGTRSSPRPIKEFGP